MKSLKLASVGLAFLIAPYLAASDSKGIDQAQYESGKKIFMTTCFACHGPNGKGLVPGVPSLTGKKSPLTQEASILKERITNGYQSKGSPMAMPPKGGNLDLSEGDIDSVIVFMQMEFLKKN